MTLFDQVSKDIVAAMKAKDKVRLQALRNIKNTLSKQKLHQVLTIRSAMRLR